MATSSGTQGRVRRYTGTFQPVDCKVAFDISQHIGSDQFANIDNNNAMEWVSLNDPTVYPTPTSFSAAEPMAMLFHSASLRGLVVARTANPCEAGAACAGSAIPWPGTQLVQAVVSHENGR